jgi:hypothetical protein
LELWASKPCKSRLSLGCTEKKQIWNPNKINDLQALWL